jgi:hypothetical protein
MKRHIWFVGLLLFLWIPLSTAQSNSMLAFLNGSGQLVVSSGDGATRWIVTNPGQYVDESLGFAWTADGNLNFALTGAGGFSGVPNTQAITPVDTSDMMNMSYLRGMSSRPNIAQPQGLSADGQYAFVSDSERYFVVALSSNAVSQLPIGGNGNAQSSGLWADNAPLVAYWGLDNNISSTALSVFHAPTQNMIIADSGSSIPMPPIAWQPNTTRLIFRTATGDVQMADVGCVVNGCADNPLERGVSVAPSSANHIQVTASHVYYVDGEQAFGVDFGCIQNNNCLDSRFVIGEAVVPLSMIHVSRNRLVYTSYTSDPNNPSDRTVQLVDLTCTPNCPPQPILNGAMAGLLSSSADYLMVDIVGEGLNILQVTDGSLVYLTDTMGDQLGAGLNTARWR